MDYEGLQTDIWNMAVRARVAAVFNDDEEWQAKARTFADECCDFFWELGRR